jgi:membrane fusion protein (multidrug efflux system)
VTLTTDLPGRTSPYRIADVRPQISGVILKRLFTEGGLVQAQQQLYQIDPAPYEAAEKSAEAALDHAKAEFASANAQGERYQALKNSNAISKADFDTAISNQGQAQADVESAQAALDTAKINLVYTKVLSPISGRTGRSITEGALVTTNQTTNLVTVQQLDPIYVDIPQSTSLLLRFKREIASGQIKAVGDNEAQVTLTLEDGTKYDKPGSLQFAEITVDQGTGSVILRAVFPNSSNLLLPGMFVTAHLEEGVSENALLVPQQCVTNDLQGNHTVLVVTSDSKVESRTIQTDRAIKNDWLVTGGLKGGDRVIISGIQKAMPGATVHATEQSPGMAAQ